MRGEFCSEAGKQCTLQPSIPGLVDRTRGLEVVKSSRLPMLSLNRLLCQYLYLCTGTDNMPPIPLPSCRRPRRTTLQGGGNNMDISSRRFVKVVSIDI